MLAPAASRGRFAVQRSPLPRPRLLPRRALPPAVVNVYGDQDVLPAFFAALTRLGCAVPELPGDVSADPEAAATAARCLADLQIPTPLEQSQILSALRSIGEKLPIGPIEPAVFRLLLAHDADTFAKLIGTYQTYLAALSDMRELVGSVMNGAAPPGA
jgi:hypothetical protein